MKRLASTRLVGLVALCALGILGILAAQLVAANIQAPIASTPASISQPPQSVAMMPVPPQSMREFVKGSEVIVIGRISRFTKEGFEGPYSTTNIEDNRNVPKPPNKYPVSYFDLEIIEVIANPRGIPLSSTVSLRGGGLYSKRGETVWDPPFYDVGDQKLYGLNMNPDGSYFTSFGAWGALNIEGDVVTFPNRARTPIKFTDKTSPNAFIKAVKKEAAKQ